MFSPVLLYYADTIDKHTYIDNTAQNYQFPPTSVSISPALYGGFIK